MKLDSWVVVLLTCACALNSITLMLHTWSGCN